MNEIKKKYTELDDGTSTLFMINEKIVNTDDYDRFMIDENNLLKILIDTTFYNPQEQLRLNIIRIQTQSEENVRKEKKMMIMH